MLITVSALKGGVGKTTACVNLAAYLNKKAPTLGVDYDPNQSLISWASREQLPFKVVDSRQLGRHAANYTHFVADTEASLKPSELKAIAEGCDLLVIPTTPDALAIEALLLMTDALRGIGAEHFRILLSIVPPFPSRTGEEARATLERLGLPLFKGEIRRLVAHQKAALAGVTADLADDPRAAEAWEDYVRIGREILRYEEK